MKLVYLGPLKKIFPGKCLWNDSQLLSVLLQFCSPFWLVCIFCYFFSVVQTREAFSSVASLCISLLTMFLGLRRRFTSKFPHTHGLGEIQTRLKFPVLKYLHKNTVLSSLSNKLMCLPRILSSDMKNSVNLFVCESFELWTGFLMGRYDCIKYSSST